MSDEIEERLPVCRCDCGCEPTEEWHNEPRCACRDLHCACIPAAELRARMASISKKVKALKEEFDASS